MKDAIKEILDEMKFMQERKVKFYSLDIYQSKILLDYITNLQERNNNLKEDFKRHIDRINELTERNDKAIEILKDTNVDMPSTLLIETIDYARHILNGGDDNE